MINGSFVFGMDEDKPDVFAECRLAIENGITGDISRSDSVSRHQAV
jgi:hypothetical protein